MQTSWASRCQAGVTPGDGERGGGWLAASPRRRAGMLAAGTSRGVLGRSDRG